VQLALRRCGKLAIAFVVSSSIVGRATFKIRPGVYLFFEIRFNSAFPGKTEEGLVEFFGVENPALAN
jgi:hypothetical protein